MQPIAQRQLWSADLGQGMLETAVVLQSDAWNRSMPSILVCPLESAEHAGTEFSCDRSHICILYGGEKCWARLDRLTPLPRSRLIRFIGPLSHYSFTAICTGLQRMLRSRPTEIRWAVLESGIYAGSIRPVLPFAPHLELKQRTLAVPLSLRTKRNLPPTRFALPMLDLNMVVCGDQIQALSGDCIRGRIEPYQSQDDLVYCLYRVFNLMPDF